MSGIPSKLDDDAFAAVETENDLLRERIKQLEALLGRRDEVPLCLPLTRQEACLFGLMRKREVLTKEMAMSALYNHRPDSDGVDAKIIDVFVCKMRKKLKPLGIEIETLWGRGYRITGPSKQRVTELLGQSNAVAAV